jgi:hypothetical protein
MKYDCGSIPRSMIMASVAFHGHMGSGTPQEGANDFPKEPNDGWFVMPARDIRGKDNASLKARDIACNESASNKTNESSLTAVPPANSAPDDNQELPPAIAAPSWWQNAAIADRYIKETFCSRENIDDKCLHASRVLSICVSDIQGLLTRRELENRFHYSPKDAERLVQYGKTANHTYKLSDRPPEPHLTKNKAPIPSYPSSLAL